MCEPCLHLHSQQTVKQSELMSFKCKQPFTESWVASLMSYLQPACTHMDLTYIIDLSTNLCLHSAAQFSSNGAGKRVAFICEHTQRYLRWSVTKIVTSLLFVYCVTIAQTKQETPGRKIFFCKQYDVLGSSKMYFWETMSFVKRHKRRLKKKGKSMRWCNQVTRMGC